MPNWWIEYQENYWESTNIGNENFDFEFIYKNLHHPNLFKIKSFGLPNEPYCRNQRSDGFCDTNPAITGASEFPAETGQIYQYLAQDMFKNLNLLRDAPATYKTNYISIPWAESEITQNWETIPSANTYFQPLVWNEALARAA